MPANNTVDTMTGLFKTNYGKEVLQLIPVVAHILRKVKFSEAEKLGKQFEVPVMLAHEHGFTYGASGAGAYALNGSVAATYQNAIVQSAQLTLQARIDYEAASKASKGDKSFVNATQVLVQNMMDSMSKRLEIMFLYGQNGIAEVNANTTTVATFVVSAASWAPGIWAGMENAELEIYSAAGDAKRGTTHTVQSVDFATRTVTLAATTSLTATDLVFFRSATATSGSAFVHAEAAGLDKILTNTGSLFNISAATYSLWKSTSYAVSGSLTVAKLLAALTQGVQRGLMEDVACIVSPKAWNGLVSTLSDVGTAGAGSRKIDASYKASKVEVGHSEVVVYGPGFKMEIIPHLFCKEGEGFIVPLKRLKRIGSTDITFTTPGRDDEIFLTLPSNAGYELRAYANQALFCESPAKCVKLTGIS